jgi:CRISPR-associated protein Cas5d
MRTYPVLMEVAGPLAMFSRPDTGGAPTSYPLPTWSAAKAVFESIAFFSDGRAWINPTRVEICRRVGEIGGHISYQRYTTNYGGSLRKQSLFSKGVASGGSSMQLFATVLVDVCYRLHGDILGSRGIDHVNSRHYLQDLFNRRLICRNVNKGGCHRTPTLGWSEFTCSYWGPPRCRELESDEGSVENAAWKKYCNAWDVPFVDQTEVDNAFSEEIPSVLVGIWDRSVGGGYAPSFCQGVQIKNGVVEFKTPDFARVNSRMKGRQDVE